MTGVLLGLFVAPVLAACLTACGDSADVRDVEEAIATYDGVVKVDVVEEGGVISDTQATAEIVMDETVTPAQLTTLFVGLEREMERLNHAANPVMVQVRNVSVDVPVGLTHRLEELASRAIHLRDRLPSSLAITATWDQQIVTAPHVGDRDVAAIGALVLADSTMAGLPGWVLQTRGTDKFGPQMDLETSRKSDENLPAERLTAARLSQWKELSAAVAASGLEDVSVTLTATRVFVGGDLGEPLGSPADHPQLRALVREMARVVPNKDAVGLLVNGDWVVGGPESTDGIPEWEALF